MAAGSGLPDPASDRAPVRVVIAYDDCCAYRRALRMLFNVVRELGDESISLRLLPRRFDFLADPTYRTFLPTDFSGAEIVMVAAGAGGALPGVVLDWLSDCLGESAGAVVALLGSPEQPDPPDSPRYQSVRNAAYRAGWIFFAPNAAPAEPTRAIA